MSTERIAELEAENAKLKARVAALEPLEKKTADLTAESRALKAGRIYDRVADELGVRPEFRDAVYKLAGSPDGEPDEKAVREHYARFLEGEGTAFKAKERKTLPKDEHAGRGGKDPGFGDGDAKRRVTRAQLADPAWTAANRVMLADPGAYDIV